MMSDRIACTAMFLSLTLATGCGDDQVAMGGDTGTTGSPGSTGSEPDPGTTSGAADTTSGADETGGSTGGEPTNECEALGFDIKPFDDSATEFGIDELVPDANFETLRGPYSLSQDWTGCDATVLIPYQGAFDGQSIEALIDDADPNTRYIIYSMAVDEVAVEQVNGIAARVESHLEALGPDAVEQWSVRFRYVSQSGTSVPLLAYLDTQGPGADFFGIDQYQRLRNGGSGAVLTGDGSWTAQISHGRYAARYYNYEARLDQRFAAQEADLGDGLEIVTIIESSWENETSTNAAELTGVVTVGFPSAEEMARFDHAEIVVVEDCGDFPGDAVNCSGERGILVSLCEGVPDCMTETGAVETFFKIISGYATGGRWTQDVSHILPHLRAGGDIPMRVNWVGAENGDLHANIQIRLYDLEDDESEDPRDAVHLALFAGSRFDEAYSERLPHYRFTPPPGTTRVTMKTHATGHGGGGNGTCAEFCTLGQHVHINGQTFDHDWVQMSSWDCAARVDQGVTPNQWGTWYFDRSNWCPGWTAEVWEIDITDVVDLDGPNEIQWSGSYQGDWPEKGSLHNKPWLTFHGSTPGQAQLEIVPKPACSNVEVRVRDFEASFPDFQPMIDAVTALPDDDPVRVAAWGQLPGVVEPSLVFDGTAWKPVLAWPEDTPPFTTSARFDQWFRDTPGVNQVVPDDAMPRVHQTRDGTAMLMTFPVDGHTAPAVPDEFGFGVEAYPDVNRGYTIEANSSFTYQPGQRIRIGSGADAWLFVDHQMVEVELGGPFHGVSRTIVELDDLGLTAGETYDIHLFIADRGRNEPEHWFEVPECVP